MIELHELLYLIIGSGGVFLTLFVLILRIRDARRLYAMRDEQGRPINGYRRALVNERLLSGIEQFMVTLLMLAAGIVALYLPPVEPTTPRLIWRTLFYAGVIYSVLLALYQASIRLDTGPHKDGK